MVGEPTYPDDAPVGDPVGGQGAAQKDEKAPGGRAPESNRNRHIATGAAIGIGSAALVAALLYANRSRKSGGQEGK